MNDAYERGCREVDAYNAHAAARAGHDIGIIIDKMLGRYDQGVVDAGAGAALRNVDKVETVKNKKKKIKKKG